MPHAEYERRREVDTSLLAAFQVAFIPRTDLYPVQQADGKYHTIHHPLLSHHLLDHLSGKLTLGAYALNTASLANWIVLDADTQAFWTGLLALADGLAQHGIIAYREPSRRGGHLWLFTPPLPGMFARRFANQLLHEHRLEGIEVYPKQDQLVTGCGSLVRLPFGVHRLTGKVYSFIQSDGQPLAPTIRDQMRLLASPARLPLPFFVSVLARVPVTPSQPKPTPTFQPTVDTRSMPLSERLKASISVLAFVSRYVQLDNRNLGLCPFHDDHIHSFGVHEEQNYWHCFAGCGGGSIIDFWMKWREKQGQDSSFTTTITELRAMLIP